MAVSLRKLVHMASILPWSFHVRSWSIRITYRTRYFVSLGYLCIEIVEVKQIYRSSLMKTYRWTLASPVVQLSNARE